MVGHEPRHIFEEDDAGLAFAHCLYDGKVHAPARILGAFVQALHGEGLAGEASGKHVVVWDVVQEVLALDILKAELDVHVVSDEFMRRLVDLDDERVLEILWHTWHGPVL